MKTEQIKKNELILRFGIWDFNDISHQELTRLIDVSPTKVYIKGEKMGAKSPQVAKGNAWLFESPLGKYTSFDNQLNSILDILEPKIEMLRPICQKYYCEISCALFIYSGNEESTPSVHLNSRYNEFIKSVNVEFDLDLYYL